jgi:hypothetical protein
METFSGVGSTAFISLRLYYKNDPRHLNMLEGGNIGFELTTIAFTGTDCIGSNNSNYYTITTMPVLSVDIQVMSEK